MSGKESTTRSGVWTEDEKVSRIPFDWMLFLVDPHTTDPQDAVYPALLLT